jgi:hypothetical protein
MTGIMFAQHELANAKVPHACRHSLFGQGSLSDGRPARAAAQDVAISHGTLCQREHSSAAAKVTCAAGAPARRSPWYSSCQTVGDQQAASSCMYALVGAHADCISAPGIRYTLACIRWQRRTDTHSLSSLSATQQSAAGKASEHITTC